MAPVLLTLAAVALAAVAVGSGPRRARRPSPGRSLGHRRSAGRRPGPFRGSRQRAVEAAVPELLDILRATVAAGVAPSRALQAVADAAPEPLRATLGEAVRRTALGAGAGRTLADVGRAEGNLELLVAGEALDLAEVVGAPPGPVLAGVVAAATDRVRTRHARLAATAQSRLSARVVASMAPGFLVVLALTAPSDAAFLVRTPPGWATLAAAAALEALGVRWAGGIVSGHGETGHVPGLAGGMRPGWRRRPAGDTVARPAVLSARRRLPSRGDGAAHDAVGLVAVRLVAGTRARVAFAGAVMLGGGLLLAAGPRLALALAVLALVVLAARRVLHRRAAMGVAARRAAAAPAVIDLLGAGLLAGLNPHLALHRVAERCPDPLRDELASVAGELRLGRSPATALRAAAERTGLDELRAAAGAIEAAERWGTPPAAVLGARAEALRSRARLHAEAEAGRAAVRLAFPLVFCFLPAFVLLTVVPTVAGSVRALML